MKKLLPIIIVIALLLGGGYLYLAKQGKAPALPGAGSAIPGMGQSMMCEYTEGSKKVTMYVKGEKIRVTSEGESGNVIIKDKVMYSWTEGQKEGVMMDLNVPTPEPGQEGAENVKVNTSVDAEKYKEAVEKYKKQCKNQSVDDSLFNTPSNVKFKDFGEMMKGSGVDVEKMMQQYQDAGQ